MSNQIKKIKETEVGLIPEEWDVIKVGQFGRVVTGKTPSRDNPTDWGSDFDFVTPTDITMSEKYPSVIARKISQAGFVRFKNMMIPPQSVMVTCIGSDMGKVVMNKKESLTNQQINSIVVNESFDNNYVYYSLKYLYPILWDHAGGGSTMPIINKSTFESLNVAVPETLDEQKRIAEIFSSLDEKIELNRKINANLESIASTLFKRWFIDFEFHDKNDKPYKSNGGKMMDSKTGKIPENWKVINFLELIDSSVNGDWGKEQKEDAFSNEVLCIRGADISDLSKGGIAKMPRRFIKDASYKNKTLKNGDIVVEISGGSPTQSTGRSVLITDELLSRFDCPLICSNFCKVIRLKNINHDGYFYTLLNDVYDRDDFFQFENGTSGIKNLNLEAFFRTTFFAISELQTEDFGLQFDSIYKMIQKNGEQSYDLSQIRDSLLPRLMSGKIRVS